MKLKVIQNSGTCPEINTRYPVIRLGECSKQEVVIDEALRKAWYQCLSMVMQGVDEDKMISALRRFMVYTNARVEMKKLAKMAIAEAWKGVRSQAKQAA